MLDGRGYRDGLCVSWPRPAHAMPHEVAQMSRRMADPKSAERARSRRAQLYPVTSSGPTGPIPGAMFASSQRTRQPVFDARCAADYATFNRDVVLEALRRTVRATWFVEHGLATMMVPHHIGDQRSRGVECTKIGSTTAFTATQPPTWGGLVELHHEASGARFYEMLYTATRPAVGSIFPYTPAGGTTLSLVVREATEIDVYEAERLHHLIASTHPTFLSIIKSTDARFRGEIGAAGSREIEPWRHHVKQWNDATTCVHPRVAHLVRALVSPDTPTAERNEVIAAMTGPVFQGVVVSYTTTVDNVPVTQLWAPRDPATCHHIMAILEERVAGVALTSRDSSTVAFLRRVLRLSGSGDNAEAPIALMNHLLRFSRRLSLSRTQNDAVGAVVHEVAVAHAIRIAEAQTRAVLPREQRVQATEPVPVDYVGPVMYPAAAGEASTPLRARNDDDDDDEPTHTGDLGEYAHHTYNAGRDEDDEDDNFLSSPPMEPFGEEWTGMLAESTSDGTQTGETA